MGYITRLARTHAGQLTLKSGFEASTAALPRLLPLACCAR